MSSLSFTVTTTWWWLLYLMASCCVIVKTYKDGRRELDDVPVPDDVVRVEPEGSDVQKMFRFVCLKQNKKLEVIITSFSSRRFCSRSMRVRLLVFVISFSERCCSVLPLTDTSYVPGTVILSWKLALNYKVPWSPTVTIQISPNLCMTII